MYYKNASTITKKFHGVQFRPGDIKESPKFINDPLMVKVDKPKEQPVKSAKSAKVETKAEPDLKPEDASK